MYATLLIGTMDLIPYPLLAVTHLTASTIVESYRLAFKTKNQDIKNLKKIIFSGGGSKNIFLLELIEKEFENKVNYCPEILTLDILDDKAFTHDFINSDNKEGCLFALLAFMHVRKMKSNIKNCTGASRNTVLGKFTPYFAD